LPETTDTGSKSKIVAHMRSVSSDHFDALTDDEIIGCLTHLSFLNERPDEGHLFLGYLHDLGIQIVTTYWITLFASQRRAFDLHHFNEVFNRQLAMDTLERLSAEYCLAADHFLLGKGAKNGREADDYGSVAIAAMIGRTYQKAGWAAAITPLIQFGSDIDSLLNRTFKTGDSKSILQNIAHARTGSMPAYDTVESPDANAQRVFRSYVSVAGVQLGHGSGRRKKIAESDAAFMALTTDGSTCKVPLSTLERTLRDDIESNQKIVNVPPQYRSSLRAALDINGLKDCSEDRFVEAFTHPSWINENPHPAHRNNRWLTWVGSALWVLWASRLVSSAGSNLSDNSPKRLLLNLRMSHIPNYWPISLFRVSRGEGRKGPTPAGQGRVMSAIVGAIALETSVDRALKWLDEKLTAEIDRVLDDPIQDPQTVLQNQVQKDSVELPEYVVEVVGNSRPRSYVARVWVEGRVLGTGLGNTIKDARRVAASVALERL